MASAVALMLCLAGWVHFLHNLNLQVILVRDVVTLASLFAATVAVIWQLIHPILSSD